MYFFLLQAACLLQLATYATAACLAHDNCLGFYGFRRPVFHSKLAFELSYNPAFMCHQNIVLRLLGRAASFEYVAGTIWQCEIELDHLALHCTAGGLLLYSWPGTTRLLATGTSHKSCHLRAVGRYENPGGIICIICPFSLDRVG